MPTEIPPPNPVNAILDAIRKERSDAEQLGTVSAKTLATYKADEEFFTKECGEIFRVVEAYSKVVDQLKDKYDGVYRFVSKQLDWEPTDPAAASRRGRYCDPVPRPPQSPYRDKVDDMRETFIYDALKVHYQKVDELGVDPVAVPRSTVVAELEKCAQEKLDVFKGKDSAANTTLKRYEDAKNTQKATEERLKLLAGRQELAEKAFAAKKYEHAFFYVTDLAFRLMRTEVKTRSQLRDTLITALCDLDVTRKVLRVAKHQSEETATKLDLHVKKLVLAITTGPDEVSNDLDLDSPDRVGKPAMGATAT